MFSKSASYLCMGAATLLLSACASKTPPAEVKADPVIARMVAQKLMLDIRYFCDDVPAGKRCTSPVTELPADLASMIADTDVGGIVLFANNLVSTKQMVKLNHDIQQASLSAGHDPLFIAVDQEGGRVVRIPHHLGTSFSGNMAIGATAKNSGTQFALQSGEIIAKELLSVGFNVNFAPTVDVNVNPLNPVINVRSFGEDADQVAKLGLAQMNAMQQQGIISSLKHFPGHGDTSVDSHTGLPRVDHDRSTINNTDLKPFKYAIDNSNPGMIMTAHIQYPQLDNSEFIAKDGSKTILPATMSRKILTDLLRTEMGFKGVIVTDALNMAGIAHYFDPTAAVIQTFKAGSDIALMPMPIRSPADIPRIKQLINDVAIAVQQGEISLDELTQSVERLKTLKQQYALNKRVIDNVEEATQIASKVLGAPQHKKIEQKLANHAVVDIANNGVYPIKDSVKKLHLLMPDQTKCMAMTFALKNRHSAFNISCTSLAGKNTDLTKAQQQIKQADLVISADITPQQSMAEMGGMDDIAQWRDRLDKTQQINTLLALMKFAKQQNKASIFISLRTPYNVPQFAPYSDAVLATFAHNTAKHEYVDDYGRLITEFSGPMFNAVADILTGRLEAKGSLPVTIKQ